LRGALAAIGSVRRDHLDAVFAENAGLIERTGEMR
jgi:hypothetical protein